jgi:hypothetical protein
MKHIAIMECLKESIQMEYMSSMKQMVKTIMHSWELSMMEYMRGILFQLTLQW